VPFGNKREMQNWLATQPGNKFLPQITQDFNKYSVVGYSNLLSSVLAYGDGAYPHCLCEVLPACQPVKIYIDVDAPKNKDWFSDEFMNDTYVPALLTAVDAALAESQIFVSDTAPVVLSSHTKEKYSLHLIWNILRPNLQSVQDMIVTLVKPKILELFSQVDSSVIDPVVYNAGRLFRLYGTPKPGKDNHLIHDPHFATVLGHTEWSRQKVLVRSLICLSSSEADLEHVPAEIKAAGLCLTDHIVVAENRQPSASGRVGGGGGGGSASSLEPRMQDSVADFTRREQSIGSQLIYELGREFQDRTISQIEHRVYTDNRGVCRKSLCFQVTPGLPCVFHSAGQAHLHSHKSNSTYISVSTDKSPFEITCKCADTDCVGFRYKLDLLNEILQIVEMRHYEK